jgi:NAD(P)H-dependent FMN reductase
MKVATGPFGRSMAEPSRILLISGSLRKQSTNAAVLRTAQQVAPANVTTVLFDGLGDLPHFNPDDDDVPLHPAVSALRAAIRTAGALLFSTPEYAGALPGSFKNLLDWTIGDDQPGSIYEKPVAWINASPRGAVDAHESLRKVLGYAGAHIVEPACAQVPVTVADIGDGGDIENLALRDGIAACLSRLAAEDAYDDLVAG